MSKAQLSAALVLVALFGLPVTAQASTTTFSTSAAVSLYTEDDDDEFEDEDEDEEEHEDEDEDDDSFGGGFEDEDDESFGGVDEDDETFVVPPVVIEPRGKGPHLHDHPAAVIPEEYTAGPLVDGAPGEAIRVDQVLPSVKTPTDVFVDTAVVGLGAVGAGALALGTMVGVRAVRARRSGEKADYFYGE